MCPCAPLLLSCLRPQAACSPRIAPQTSTGPGVLATSVLSRGWGTGVKAPSQWCESVG